METNQNMRIGNTVHAIKCDGSKEEMKVDRIITIDSGTMKGELIVTARSWQVEPIELTDEKLVERSFTKENERWHNKSFESLWSLHISDDGDVELQMIRDDEMAPEDPEIIHLPKSIKYLHDLENLWFELTRTTLTK